MVDIHFDWGENSKGELITKIFLKMGESAGLRNKPPSQV